MLSVSFTYLAMHEQSYKLFKNYNTDLMRPQKGQNHAVLTDFTTLANELQRMLRLVVFSTVASKAVIRKSNVLTEEKSVSDNDVCTEERNKDI